MKRSFFMISALACLLLGVSPALGAGVTLRYHFKPGQQWECIRMTQMVFSVMGQKQVKKERDTIIYTVSEGQRKGWVRLSARYSAPAQNAESNPLATAKTDLIFNADVHVSGDTRNVTVSGMEKHLQNPALDVQQKAALEQTYNILADTLPAVIFWFPELPEERLALGDLFEDQRTVGTKNQYMGSKTKTRRDFVLEEISEDLAYFSTTVRHATKTTTMGSKVDTAGSGKGEIVFDLKEGMWVELTTKTKMRISGAMMGGGEEQHMLITEKVHMQLR